MLSKIFLLLTLIPTLLQAQIEVELTIRVTNNKQAALPGAMVKLVETGTGEVIEKKTDAGGSAQFILDHGKVWKIYINGSDMGREVPMPEQGRMVNTMKLTYNPELMAREGRQSTDRTGFTWTMVDHRSMVTPPQGKALLKVDLKSRSGIPQKNVRVRIFINGTREGIESLTGADGRATFVVDPGRSYDIDVAEILNLAYADIPNRAGMIITRSLQYEVAAVAEQRYGDTIVQRIDKETPASGRAFFTLEISRYQEGPAANETVYLQEINGSDVYIGYTDEEGIVHFLLPLGKKYMVHFNFERDVDVVDLSKSKGYVTGSITLTYRPNPRLEHPELFVPKTEELFLVGFEEFLKKQYPKPKSPNEAGIFLRWGNTFNKDSKEALLEIGITAEGAGKRIPGNYSFVLDRSGSMAGYYRLEMLKYSMKELVKKLRPDDYISLVVYDTEMNLVFPHQLLGNKKEELIKLIDGIEAGGGTNMLESMKLAYSMVDKVFSTDRNNAVILLTDGHDANEPDVLQAVQRSYHADILCTAIGVGEDYNYPLMQLLAEKGRGRLFHVADSADFERVFLQEILSQMHPVASKVVLEVEYPEAFGFKHLYGRTPLSSKGNVVRYALPNLYSGTNQVALALLELKKANPEIENTPVIVRLRYQDGNGKEVVVEEKIFPVWEPGSGQKELVVEAELKKLYAMAEINRALKIMSDAYTAGDDEKARKILEQTTAKLKSLYPNAEDEDVKRLMDQMDQYLVAFRNLADKKRLEQKEKLKVK